MSEEERNAKTHKGTWQLFRETFVEAGRFDEQLFTKARGTQQRREATDDDASVVPRDEAEELAAQFVDAVAELLG